MRFLCFLFFFLLLGVEAEAAMNYEKVANAIYLAEGGDKTKYPYGIRSMQCRDKAHARQICINSIRNNERRWKKAGSRGDFFEFMRSRYSPGWSNRHWTKNVKFFLASENQQE